MQFHVSFSGPVAVPLAYQRLVQGLIYHALESAPDYRRFLHERGYGQGEKRIKCFTFGRLQGRFVREGGTITFPEGCNLELRSSDPYMIQCLLAGLPLGSSQRIGQSEVKVLAARLDDRHVISDSIEIGMLSPVTVYQTLPDGKTDYAAPDEERFYSLIWQNARSKWTELMGLPFPEDFTVEPLVVTPKDKVVTSYKGTYITGWMGTYRLRGPQTLLDLLYQIGLGAKNSQGFGMFQVL